MYEHIEQFATELQVSDKLLDSFGINSTSLKTNKCDSKSKCGSLMVNFNVLRQNNCECVVQRILNIGNTDKTNNGYITNLPNVEEKGSSNKLTGNQQSENYQEILHSDTLKSLSETVIDKILPVFEEGSFSDNGVDNEISFPKMPVEGKYI